MVKKISERTGYGLLLIFCLSIVSIAQIDSAVKDNRIGYSIIDKEGWVLPKPESLEFQNDQNVYFEEVEVLQTRYKPRSGSDADVSLFFVDENGTLTKLSKTGELKTFLVYSAAGKTFAYYLEYNQIGSFENGKRAYFGPLVSFRISDEDGDGVFETRTYTGTGMIKTIPEWVKKLPGIKFKPRPWVPSTPLPLLSNNTIPKNTGH